MKLSALVISLLLAASACTSYQVVKRDDKGGVIALDRDTRDAHDDAAVAMNKHCNGRYKILRQGEELVSPSAAEFDMATSERMSDQYRHEYRITYVCQQR